MPTGVTLTILSLAVGWAALMPLRQRLGSVGYHLAALPVGLLGWAMVAALAFALEMGLGWALVSVGLWVALVAVLGMLATRNEGMARHPAPPWWSYLAVLGVLVAFSWVIAASGITAYSVDGWSQYVPDGLGISETGLTTGRALGHRMVLLTSIHAGYFALGGEFPYVIHPVMGLVTAALVFAGIWWAGRRSRIVVRVLVASVVTALLVSNAVYLFMSLYIHSHMITAMYLLASVVAIERATGWLGRKNGPDGAIEPAWMLVAGFASSAVLLARPDGPAYSVIPLALAAAVLLRERAPARVTDSYFAPLVVTSTLVTAAAVLQKGIWDSDKLSGAMLIAFIAGQAVAWVVVRWLACRDLGWIARGTNAIKLAVGLNIPGLMVVWRRAGDQGVTTFQNMSTNLLQQGGYRFVWPYAAGVIGMSLALRPKSTRHPFTPYLLYTIFQFFAVALAVHALNQPGRLGWGDSFNRVAFHILPVVYLYAGFYLSELAAAVARTRD
jgi:hypothetical protein